MPGLLFSLWIGQGSLYVAVWFIHMKTLTWLCKARTGGLKPPAEGQSEEPTLDKNLEVCHLRWTWKSLEISAEFCWLRSLLPRLSSQFRTTSYCPSVGTADMTLLHFLTFLFFSHHHHIAFYHSMIRQRRKLHQNWFSDVWDVSFHNFQLNLALFKISYPALNISLW